MHKNAGNFFSCSVSIIFEPADRLHFLHIVDLNIHKDDERHLGLANIKSRLNFVELCWLLWSFWMCNRKTSPRKEATQCRIYRHLSAGLQIFPQLCPKCLLVLWLGWTFAISSDSFHCCRRGSHLFVCGQWHPVLEDLRCVRPEKMAASHDLSNVYRCSSLLTLMLHSLKLTVRPLKMDGWNTILSYWGFSPFSGTTSLLVSGSIYMPFFRLFDGLCFCLHCWGMNLITSTFLRRQRLAQLCFICGCQRCAADDLSRRISCPSSCGGFCRPCYPQLDDHTFSTAFGPRATVIQDAKSWRCDTCKVSNCFLMDFLGIFFKRNDNFGNLQNSRQVCETTMCLQAPMSLTPKERFDRMNHSLSLRWMSMHPTCHCKQKRWVGVTVQNYPPFWVPPLPGVGRASATLHAGSK